MTVLDRRSFLRTTGAAAAAAAATAAPSLARAAIPIRIASPTADDDPIGIGATHLAKRLKELAGNDVAVRIFPRGVMGGESQALEQTLGGNIDVQIVSNSVLSTVVPELAVLDVPYGLSGLDHAWRVLDGTVGKSLDERILAKRLRPAGWAFGGSRCLLTRTKPVRRVADLAGMKIRVPPNETYNNIVKAWQAVATTIPWPETYLALSQGVVDAIETAPGPSFDQKHFEVAKNLIRTDHLLYFHVWVFSEKSWQAWPQNVRDAAMVAAREAAMMNRKLRIEQEIGIFEQYGKRGVTVIEPDRAEFAASLKPVRDAVRPELAPLLKQVQAAA